MWGESLVRWGVGMGRACAGCLVAVLEGAGVFASELCGVSAARFRRVPGFGRACAVVAGVLASERCLAVGFFGGRLSFARARGVPVRFRWGFDF